MKQGIQGTRIVDYKWTALSSLSMGSSSGQLPEGLMLGSQPESGQGLSQCVYVQGQEREGRLA